jgi:hypothetical protein
LWIIHVVRYTSLCTLDGLVGNTATSNALSVSRHPSISSLLAPSSTKFIVIKIVRTTPFTAISHPILTFTMVVARSISRFAIEGASIYAKDLALGW